MGAESPNHTPDPSATEAALLFSPNEASDFSDERRQLGCRTNSVLHVLSIEHLAKRIMTTQLKSCYLLFSYSDVRLCASIVFPSGEPLRMIDHQYKIGGDVNPKCDMDNDTDFSGLGRERTRFLSTDTRWLRQMPSSESVL